MSFQERECTPCFRCGGMGWQRQRCPTCWGSKKVGGNWCSTCDGVGEIHEQCPDCRGQGVVQRMWGSERSLRR
jgi:DnaJ-class molecular chaperone